MQQNVVKFAVQKNLIMLLHNNLCNVTIVLCWNDFLANYIKWKEMRCEYYFGGTSDSIIAFFLFSAMVPTTSQKG